MSFGESFLKIFTTMQILPAVFLIAGLILVIIEIFKPGFGFFGVAGSVCLLVAIIVQAAVSRYTVLQTVILVVLLLIIIVILFVLMLIMMKLGWISHKVIVKKEPPAPTDAADGVLDYVSLVGKTGIAATSLRPFGRILIDGKEYNVIAHNGMKFKKDAKLIVVKIKDAKIIVREIREHKSAQAR